MGEAAARAGRTSWWSRFRADLSLPIEHRGFVLWYLIFERGIKGVLLLVAGTYIALHAESGLSSIAGRLIEDLGLNTGSDFLRHWLYQLVLRFLGMGDEALLVLAVGALVYGLIEASESVGLILRRRWAEYLVVLATAFFIPVEVREVIVHLTVLKLVTLLINIAVVVYLVRKKRLFQFDEAAANA